MDPLSRAINTTGSVSALADAVGVSAQAVCNWRSRGNVPAAKARAIEQATEGAVTRQELRPDIFGDLPATTEGKRDAA